MHRVGVVRRVKVDRSAERVLADKLARAEAKVARYEMKLEKAKDRIVRYITKLSEWRCRVAELGCKKARKAA